VTPSINGWRIFAHPCLLSQIERVGVSVALMLASGDTSDLLRNRRQFLKALVRVMTEVVPASPGAPEHRLGHSLGPEATHWFRVKFLQQFRLFYRYDSKHKVIVFAWVNDESTLRSYGSKNDAYAVFKKMLDGGNPPSTFEELLLQSREL
jgi:toxin YhaV